MQLIVNDYGLVRVKILKPGVEMHMINQIAGFTPSQAQILIDRGFAQQWTDEDVARAEELEQEEKARTEYSNRQVIKKPGMGAPGSQTGSNVSHLERQGGLVESHAGLVLNDASVSERSIGDMTNTVNQPVIEGTAIAGNAGGTELKEGDVVLKDADGEDVIIPANWENQHHMKTLSAARRISGKEELNTEEAKAVITKALEDRQAAQDEE